MSPLIFSYVRLIIWSLRFQLLHLKCSVSSSMTTSHRQHLWYTMSHRVQFVVCSVFLPSGHITNLCDHCTLATLSCISMKPDTNQNHLSAIEERFPQKLYTNLSGTEAGPDTALHSYPNSNDLLVEHVTPSVEHLWILNPQVQLHVKSQSGSVHFSKINSLPAAKDYRYINQTKY